MTTPTLRVPKNSPPPNVGVVRAEACRVGAPLAGSAIASWRVASPSRATAKLCEVVIVLADGRVVEATKWA